MCNIYEMYVCLSVCDVFLTKTTNLCISTKNKDNDTKPSGYDPWGHPRSSMLSRMTLSFMSPVRNPPMSSKYPPSWPPLPDTLPIKIWARNFQGTPWGEKHHSWRQEWPCPPFLRSGTPNVLQVPAFLAPPSWHTSNWDINTKFSGYLPLSLHKLSID